MIGMIASLPRAYEFKSNLLQEDAKFKEKESFARINYNETEAKAFTQILCFQADNKLQQSLKDPYSCLMYLQEAG